MNSDKANNKLRKNNKSAFKAVQGFTMLELMISLALGLVLFAGVMSVFVGMRTTTSETSSFGELQENGRFAMSVLTEDLLLQDFWGDFSGVVSRSNFPIVPGNPGSDCVGGGINNATFPVALGNFRTLWGVTLTDASPDPMSCFSTPAGTRTRDNSDVIQIKRAIGNPIDAANVMTAGNYYLTTNSTAGEIFPFGGAVSTFDDARTWQFQHHIYYVREELVGSDYIPVLMQGRLANLNMGFSPVVDGIEMIRFMYGIGNENTGVVDRFVSASNMTSGLWDKAGGTRILAVKVYVLARGSLPDNKYDNENTYQLGDFTYTVDDNYRRLLFSSTVTIYNGRVDTW